MKERVAGERARRWCRVAAALAVAIAVIVVCGCGSSSDPNPVTPEAKAKTAGSKFAELPTKRCVTEQGIEIPAVPLDKTTVVPAAAADLEGFAAYRNAAGTTVVAPRGWQCSSVVSADGGENIFVTPDGADPFKDESTQAVTYVNSSACQGCMASELCALFPDAAPVQSYTPGFKCDRPKPLRETVSKTGEFTAYFEDPPDVAGQGTPSGGEYRATGILSYSDAIGVRKLTCTLETNLESACPSVVSASMLSSFLNLPG